MLTEKPLSLRLRAACALLLGISCLLPAAAQEGIPIPPLHNNPHNNPHETDAPGGLHVAVLAGGCFWGVQGVFQHVKGVQSAVSGYAGGSARDANYRAVVAGRSGHAEAVHITYDPQIIGYGDILQIYFSAAHDPTQLNRQGPDRGTQYRSAIFPQNARQARMAADYVQQLNAARVHRSAIVTTIEADQAFYPAEDYHQDYMTRHPTQPYIVINDRPKLEHLKRLFPARFRAQPRLVGQGK